MEVIKVKGLRKAFGDKLVLNGVSMTVYQGDIYGFLGPNGSGKTTTLRILLGILTPDGGKVEVLGINPPLKGNQLRQRVNALPESHGFYGWMQAVEYLRFFGQLYGLQLTSKDYRKHLEQVGLDPTDHRPIRTFSRGMKQRLGIARALLNSPEILFLDEPTNGLDPKGRRKIHDLLLQLNRDKKVTVVISTHILDDVERLCNRTAILHGTKVRYEGPLTAPSNEKTVYYRFRVEGEKELPSLWNFPDISLIDKRGQWITCSIKDMSPALALKALIEEGMPVVEAVQVTNELESIYFKYTQESVS